MKIGEITFDEYHPNIIFSMWGDTFAAQCGDKRVFFDDNQLIDHFNGTSYTKEKCIDPKSLGINSDRLIKIPFTVLKTKDLVRFNRANDSEKQTLTKIGESFQHYGLLEYFVFNDTLILYFEKYHIMVSDKDLIKTNEGIFISNELSKEIPEPNIPVPDNILAKLKDIRDENEHKRRFRTLAIKDGFKFILNEDKLIIQYEGKEATATEICSIYGRPAVNVKDLDLGFPFLQLPPDVESEFKRVMDNKIPKGLKLIACGKSLLNSREYYKMNLHVSENIFDKVKVYFEWYGEASEDFSGWLTCYPEKVAEILKI